MALDDRRGHAMSAPVYIRVERPEGYEDVCTELVVADFAEPSPHQRLWPYGDATAYVERLEAALVEYAVASDRYCDAGEPQSRYYGAQNAVLVLGREIAGREP